MNNNVNVLIEIKAIRKCLNVDIPLKKMWNCNYLFHCQFKKVDRIKKMNEAI